MMRSRYAAKPLTGVVCDGSIGRTAPDPMVAIANETNERQTVQLR
jgi:hypothetical protein